MDRVFIPLHIHGNHWTLLVICFTEKTIRYFDSYLRDVPSKGGDYIDCVKSYLLEEYAAKYDQTRFSFDGWEFFISTHANTPQQPDNYNCGVFVLKLTELIADGVDITNTSLGASKDELIRNLVNFRADISKAISGGTLAQAVSPPKKRKHREDKAMAKKQKYQDIQQPAS